jgi:hypothetical protein
MVDTFPKFEALFSKNPNYPVDYVKRCFENGLQVSDTYEGKNVCDILLDSLLNASYTAENNYEIDAMLELCMDRPTFEARLRSFTTLGFSDTACVNFGDATCIEDVVSNYDTKGYLIQYGRKHGFDTTEIDMCLSAYDSVEWEDTNLDEDDETNWPQIAFSNLKYWSEYAFPPKCLPTSNEPFVDVETFYSRKEMYNVKKTITKELQKNATDFEMILSLLKTYELSPSEVMTVHGLTTLMKACHLGNEPVVDQLLKMDVDIDEEDVDGETPITYAMKSGVSSIVDKLRTAGFCDNDEEEEEEDEDF